MEVKRLSSELVSRLSGCANISSTSQCVFELVSNSLDAKSTAIAVRCNFINFKIQVADNGCGIPKWNLELVGEAHCTNKCSSIQQLSRLKSYGYRGEALHSIHMLSSDLIISSRQNELTFSKTFSNNSIKPMKMRASQGTTVTILGWLATCPVRQLNLIPEIELEEIKTLLEKLSIIHPKCSFSLRNDANGRIVLTCPQNTDIVGAVKHFHPEVSTFNSWKIAKDHVTVQLLISKQELMKKWIYVYVNKYPVENQRILAQFKAFKNAIVLSIKCPQNCLEISGNHVEFTCWKLINKCIGKLITKLNPDSRIEKQQAPCVKNINVEVSMLRGAIQACATKRNEAQTIGNYMIENSVEPPPIRSIIKKKQEPLNIQRIVPDLMRYNQEQGKELIMDMFLKLTEIFHHPTFEQSNVVLERDFQDPTTGCNTTISINVKRRKLDTVQKNPGNSLRSLEFDDPGTVDDYTIVLNQIGEKRKFQFIRKEGTRSFQASEEFLFRLDATIPNSAHRSEIIPASRTPQPNPQNIRLENHWISHRDLKGNEFYVNARTGMVSARTPHVSEYNFRFGERLDFVPKGLSPVLESHKPVDVSLSPHAKQGLQELILELYDDELVMIKWQNYISGDPKEFFEEIYKQKTRELVCKEIPSILTKKTSGNSISFSRNLLKHVEVVGQLDKKFIVAKIQDLLVLFDQHAVHERIRLEQFTADYKQATSRLNRPITIFMPITHLDLLKHHATSLKSFGFTVNFFSSALQLIEIPLCLKERFLNEEDLQRTITELLKEFVDSLRTGTVPVPTLIQETINLKACRGAIKFGDKLTPMDCTTLMTNLSKCQLPFQCAHGRPTLSPIMNLTKFPPPNKALKPRLDRLK